MEKKILAVFCLGLASLLWYACTPEDELSGASQVEATFRLKADTAMGGKITINDVFLKLDRIHVAGSRNGEANADITHTITQEDPPYQLRKADSSTVSFTLPASTFDKLDFEFFLVQDAYELILVNNAPPPAAEPEDSNPGTDTGDSSNENGGNNDQGGENNDSVPDPTPDDGAGGGEPDPGENDGGDDEEEDGDEGEDKDNDGEDKDDEQDKEEDNDDKDDEDKDEEDDDNKDDDNKNDGDGKNKGDKGDGGGDKDGNGKGDSDGHKSKDKKKSKDKDEKGNGGKDDDGRASEGKNGVAVDLDHFFQNATPGMIIFATYEINGKYTNIIFVAGGLEKFYLPAKQNDSFTISLGENNTAEVTFDPRHWFSEVSISDIESATRQIYQQQEVIFIHPDFNGQLYEMLAPRLEESADLHFPAERL